MILIQTNLLQVPFSDHRIWSANRYPTGEVFSWFEERQIERGSVNGWCFIQGVMLEITENENGVFIIGDAAVAHDFIEAFDLRETSLELVRG